ncbi:MAG: hypothetical protein O2967_10360 [Proteobacteria bacterium]|nr:hypothetical protein [Pseudomonadota bacterium]
MAIALLATLAALAGLCWYVYDAAQIGGDTDAHIVELERARGDIVYFDEVLTMSASMAAATGEVAWIDHYRVFELKLYTAIETAIGIARQRGIADAISETEAANGELVRMENQVFELVRELELGEARAILSGDRYLIQKQVYASGMGKFLRVLRAEQAFVFQSQQVEARNLIWVTAAAGASVVLVWLLVLVRVHRWRLAMSIV